MIISWKEKNMNKYHFSVSIHFDCDYDVKNLEHILNLKPYSITPTKNLWAKQKVQNLCIEQKF